MRAILLGAVAALGLCPAIASAIVVVNVGTTQVVQSATDRVVPVDVWCDPTEGDTTNDALDAFTIGFDAPTFTDSGVRFQVPSGAPWPTPDPEHPYVFTGKNAPPEDFGSSFNRAQVGAAITTAGVDITDSLNGLVRLQVVVPANTPVGFYRVVIDPAAFSLGGGPSLAAAAPGTAGGVDVVIPEPASLGLIVFGGLLALRRRRVA